MGYMRHHAIIVSTWDEGMLNEAHDIASRIFPVVSDILDSAENGEKSFFIPPDGSKEGRQWEASRIGDAHREEFVEWLIEQEYEDGSNTLGWVEVQYADDDLDTRIVRSRDGRSAEAANRRANDDRPDR